MTAKKPKSKAKKKEVLTSEGGLATKVVEPEPPPKPVELYRCDYHVNEIEQRTGQRYPSCRWGCVMKTRLAPEEARQYLSKRYLGRQQ